MGNREGLGSDGVGGGASVVCDCSHGDSDCQGKRIGLTRKRQMQS